MRWMWLVVVVCRAVQAATFASSLDVGVVCDQFQWSIGGPVPIYSELTWKDLRGPYLAYRGEVSNEEGYLVSLIASYSRYFDGHGRDSDYELPRRQGEWSRSVSDTRGCCGGVSLGLGMRSSQWGLISGFGWRQLFVSDRNGVVVVASDKHGTFETWYPLAKGVDATYRANWYTGWSALEWVPVKRSWLEVKAQVRMDAGLYHAIGDWRLRLELDRLEHLAGFYGGEAQVEMKCFLSSRWTLQFLGGTHYWFTGKGRAEFHFTNGEGGHQPFRRAEWWGWRLACGLTFTI